jgi:hypothetical protein
MGYEIDGAITLCRLSRRRQCPLADHSTVRTTGVVNPPERMFEWSRRDEALG